MARTLKKGILSTPYIQRANSVPTPPAQSATLLQVYNNEKVAYDTLVWIARQGWSRFGHYAIGCDLLLSGGLRISELISEKWLFVNAVGQVVIKGKKGSNDKLVTPLYCAEYWRGLRGWCLNPCNIVSRFSWYRFLKAQGVVLREKGKVNASVTHAARKLKAHEMFVNELEQGTIKEVIGHKSERSTTYYKPKV